MGALLMYIFAFSFMLFTVIMHYWMYNKINKMRLDMIVLQTSIMDDIFLISCEVSKLKEDRITNENICRDVINRMRKQKSN